jgi:NADPH:quinone reductase
VLLKNYSIVGVHWGAAAARDPAAMPRTFSALLAQYTAGLIDPVIFQGEPFPFAQAPNALALLGDRGTYGKVVVDPHA